MADQLSAWASFSLPGAPERCLGRRDTLVRSGQCLKRTKSTPRASYFLDEAVSGDDRATLGSVRSSGCNSWHLCPHGRCRNSQSRVRPKPTQIHLPGFMERRRALHRDDKLLICHRVLVEPEVACSLHDDKESWWIFDSFSWPVTTLISGGVLAEWSASGSPSWTIDDAKGKTHTIGGMTAKVQVIRPGSCDAIGGQETINAVVEEAVPDNYYSFTACIRGPNLARTTYLGDGFSPLNPVLQKHLTETCPRTLPVR